MSQYYGGASRSIESPITQSGRVVLNGVKDLYTIAQRNFQGQGEERPSDDHFSLMTHELAFYDSQRTYENLQYKDTRVPVFTCFCGMDSAVALDAEFIGVIGSRAIHSTTNQALNEEDTTIQVGGLCTIMNNGGDTICPGDDITARVPYYGANLLSPANHVLGTPKGKAVALVYKKRRGDYHPVIGRAMSHSKPNSPLDMLLV